MPHYNKLFSRLFHVPPSQPPLSPQPWLIIGLGNPGEKYQSTRHNVGFDMIDLFAQSLGISTTSVHFKSHFGEGKFEGTPILLAKPQTYMNLSGESRTFATKDLRCPKYFHGIKLERCSPSKRKYATYFLEETDLLRWPLAAYYKLPLNRVLVIYDDMDLPCGVLRIQPRGGHGHHNGLKNVIYHFRGNREFCRLRVGIGRPPGQMDPKAFLLQKFNKTARARIDAALEEGVEILKMLLTKGLTECVNSANAEQKYKHLRVQNLPP